MPSLMLLLVNLDIAGENWKKNKQKNPGTKPIWIDSSDV